MRTARYCSGFIDLTGLAPHGTRHLEEGALHPGSFVLAALLSLDGPFFPTSLVPAGARADTRRCVVAAQVAQSDCALIGSQWVVTTAGAVASARPVAGRLRVRVGDTDFAVDQLVYHPKWNGGTKFDVTLLKLADRVPSFPLLPPPGEYPVHIERVTHRALPHREWVSQTIGPSPVWEARDPAPRESTLLSRVRSLMDGIAGRSGND